MSRRSYIWIILASALSLTIVAPHALRAQVPAAPSDVQVFVVGENAIDVSWVDNSDNEAAFDIFRTDNGGDERRVGAVDRDLTFFQDRASGLVPAVEYCYVVRARNASGSSPPSAQACTVIPRRPIAPSGLITSRDGDNTPVILSWIDNANNEEGFLIYRDTRGTGFLLIDTVDVSVSRFEDRSIREDGEFCYFVSAFNVSGESDGTNISCLEIIGGPPALPTSFDIETLSGTEIELNWSFDVITYATLFVERSLETTGPWTRVYETAELDTQYVDTGLDSATEYCYRLALESASSAISTTDVLCSRTDFVVPPTPDSLEAIGFDDFTVELTWTSEPSPQVLFVVEVRVGVGTFEVLADSVSELEYTDTVADDEEIYCYRVKAVNPEFESGYSNVACSIIPPAAVSNLELNPNPGRETSELIATWQQGEGSPATSFEVSYRVAGSGEFSDPRTTNGLSLLISDLDDFVEYEVRVVAAKAIDSVMARSEPVFALGTTLLSIWPGDINDDGVVGALDVVVLTSDACYGRFTGMVSADSLNVSWAERPTDPGDTDVLLLRCDTDRNGTVNIFDFLAIASNAGREVDGRTATPAATASIESDAHRERLQRIFEWFTPSAGNEAQQQLRPAYPNPVQRMTNLSLDLPSSATVKLSVIDMAGRTVRVDAVSQYEAGRHELSLDTGGLAGGVYFVVVDVDATQLIRPIVVIR
jgi:fibronectin type 3 domain-containing protein